LRKLPPAARFQVIAYNRRAEPLLAGRPSGLLPADPATVEEVARLVAGLDASGGTDHAGAVRRGLLLRPDVLFLVTDAAELAAQEVQALTRLNQGRTAVHVVELGRGRAGEPAAALRRLAAGNGGTYRRVLLR
jgi:hypothetical protein